MVNRCANFSNTIDDKLPLLTLLEEAAMHPKASPTTKEAALDYLNYQKSRIQ
jgi:hypothetical protein